MYNQKFKTQNTCLTGTVYMQKNPNQPKNQKQPKNTKKTPKKLHFLLWFYFVFQLRFLGVFFLFIFGCKVSFYCVSVRQRNVAPDFSWKSCICIKEKISVCHCPHLSSKSQNKEKDPFPICFLGFLLIISNFPSIQISLWQRT